jgi:hypothetical protein
MERGNSCSFKALESQETETAKRRKSAGRVAQSYRAPQLLVIGKAVNLVQRDGSGHVVDGTGGWWVWKS